jgi:3-dehydroquinate dehydratase II
MQNKILIINGPNLSLLGKREKDVYGSFTLKDIENKITKKAKELKVNVEFFQSDIEGEIVKKIGSTDSNAIIINPGAYTHTSIAIHDAIKGVNIPSIEVHISHIYKREEFRHKSIISSACIGQISGFSIDSYILALIEIKNRIFDGKDI